jgi:hypothetical protein
MLPDTAWSTRPRPWRVVAGMNVVASASRLSAPKKSEPVGKSSILRAIARENSASVGNLSNE